MQHNAVLVVTLVPEPIYRWLDLLPRRQRSMFAIRCAAEGYVTIVLCPDCHKEATDGSNEWDVLRSQFIEFLRSVPATEWVEVSFGEFGHSVINAKFPEDIVAAR